MATSYSANGRTSANGKTRQPAPEDVRLAKALHRIRSSGNPIDLATAGDIGKWIEVLEALNDAAKDDGARGVETVLKTLLRTDPRLQAILATIPVDDTDSGTDGDDGADKQQESVPEDKYFEFLEFSGLRSLPQPEWLFYGVLPTKGVNFLYGKEGCGKTYVSVGMAIAVASEKLSWLGRLTKHGHVVYIAAEDIDEVAIRFIGTAHHYGLDDVPNLHIYPCPLSLATDAQKLIESLEYRYKDINPVLIVVDTLAMCSIGIEENSAKDFGLVIASLEALWRKFNCCIVAVHHSGKNGEMRGTSAMDGVAYSKILVSEEDENVKLKSIKKRRGKAFDDIYLDRKVVEIPGMLDEMLLPVTTCVLVKSDRIASSDPQKLTPLQQKIMDALTALGCVGIARTELIKACVIARGEERSFGNAINGLVKKGIVSISRLKQRTSYSLVPQETQTGENTTYTANAT